MSRHVLIVLTALFIAGCASAPPQIPIPQNPDSAGIGIHLRVRVSGLATYRADIVYFVKNCLEPVERCDDRLLASNFAKDGRIYLLNAEPGKYRAVAAAFESGVLGDNSLYFTYFPGSLTNETVVDVWPGRLANAGSYLVSASYGLCPDNAEARQLQDAEIIERGTPKCGLFRSLLGKLGSGNYVFIGGKAYAAGTQTYHYRGTGFEKQQTPLGSPGFLEAARSDLAGSAWEAITIAKP